MPLNPNDGDRLADSYAAGDIELAAELLDAVRPDLAPEDFDRRRRLIDDARAPRVPYLKRQDLLDEACAGIEHLIDPPDDLPPSGSTAGP